MSIEQVVNYLNEHFNQECDDYCIVNGAKPQVIRLDNETAVSTWACGAIVCINKGVYFISEDDGYWFCENGSEYTTAVQSPFSLAWGDSFIKAFNNLNEYVKKNGKPYYYDLGTDDDGNTLYSTVPCGYELI